MKVAYDDVFLALNANSKVAKLSCAMPISPNFILRKFACSESKDDSDVWVVKIWVDRKSFLK